MNTDTPNGIERLREALEEAQTVVVGVGAGLSASAGLVYDGERFEKYFQDFAEKYGIQDMYAGGFYPYATWEEYWGWWSRAIWINRYVKPPKPVYEELLGLLQGKDYFVITTNVDHQLQKAGFDKERIFYTQGDYGLWQCGKPCHKRTYDNKGKVVKMLYSQGFTIGSQGELEVPTGEEGQPDFSLLEMSVTSDLVPLCPVCGEPMTMNLRADDTFVEDEGWHRHAELYERYLEEHRDSKTLFLELGVGGNTPVIIKSPFLRMTQEWPDATYACINAGEAFAPAEVKDAAICINADIGEVLGQLRKKG